MSSSGSWHEQYKDSAHIFVGGLPFNLTEGDIICVLSQFGEVAGLNLVRDKESGKSKGFAFLKYVDQRSTTLAVDNMNGSKIGGRVIRVDHVQNYKVPKVFDEDGNEVEPDEDTVNNVAPKPIEEESDDGSSSESEAEDDTGIDIDDPMREYLLKKRRKKDKKTKKSKRSTEKGEDDTESKAERKARREQKRAAKKAKKDKKDKKDEKDKVEKGVDTVKEVDSTGDDKKVNISEDDPGIGTPKPRRILHNHDLDHQFQNGRLVRIGRDHHAHARAHDHPADIDRQPMIAATKVMREAEDEATVAEIMIIGTAETQGIAEEMIVVIGKEMIAVIGKEMIVVIGKEMIVVKGKEMEIAIILHPDDNEALPHTLNRVTEMVIVARGIEVAAVAEARVHLVGVAAEAVVKVQNEDTF
ncbi:hypothetical protein BGZ76_003705 [Entomortierella beljakovae]|nr:hypothetical protein BGZ76_003705 [Entomortierella beljakovae]